MVDKKVGVFASTASNAEVVFPLGWFTPHITLFAQGLFEVPDELRQKLQEHGYQIVTTPIKQFLGEDHQMNGVELEDGTVIPLEAGLISMGSKYHADYLEKFDLEKQGGNLVTDKMARTSHPRIFAIGDLKVCNTTAARIPSAIAFVPLAEARHSWPFRITPVLSPANLDRSCCVAKLSM